MQNGCLYGVIANARLMLTALFNWQKTINIPKVKHCDKCINLFTGIYDNQYIYLRVYNAFIK